MFDREGHNTDLKQPQHRQSSTIHLEAASSSFLHQETSLHTPK